MRLHEVLVRWYKSFNYDYELKANPASTKHPWQDTPDGWLPHVRIRLEDDVTAVVGANESGKSHLLDVVSILLNGERHSQRDFCRYSNLFSVEKGQRRYPEVGGVFKLIGDDAATLAALEIPTLSNGDLLMLRPEPSVVEVIDGSGDRIRLETSQVEGLQSLVPHVYHLKTQIDLPDSVSIAALAGTEVFPANRRRRVEALQLLNAVSTVEQIGSHASTLLDLLASKEVSESEQQRLGRVLLTKIAHIETSAFRDLQEAIADEREGLVNALIQEMNKSIARHLNISKWWSQDEDFQLRVSPREHELVFTIRDRTGTDYSFSERSRGLTYFLSYYVQLRSHDRPPGRPEVLLMDEPDAYLSALGQQDLLRVLEDHAHPEDSDRRDQIVYVTHSPFLINRNAGHRVRVVDKGARDEGTRLVKDATRNHYEPLRTSLGAFVAETAFIGGENLFVEGISDQVLLSGMNARLRRQGVAPSECLDLNQVTLVPGGSNMPYMLYLARGRDEYKPACAVLLDSDTAGVSAQQAIRKGGARGKPTVADDLIVMLGEWAIKAGARAEAGVRIEEPEDLIPLKLALIAARRYAVSLLGLSATESDSLSEKAIKAHLTQQKKSMWDAVESAFRDQFDTDIGKAGFAKELLVHLHEQDLAGASTNEIECLEFNFASLIKHLAGVLRLAREREFDSRRNQRVDRIIREFVDDHPMGCLRDRAAVALGRIDAAADNSASGDVIRAGTAMMRRDFELDTDPLERVPNYSEFLARFAQLPVLVRLNNQGVLNVAAIDAEPVDPS